VVAEICKRAVRPNSEAIGDQLADGTWITLSPGGDDLPRLAVAGRRRLSPFECSLLTLVADRSSPIAVPSRTLDLIHGDQRSDDGSTPAVILIDLVAFEQVRLVAGHLTAERVVSDAAARMQALLRAGDELMLLGEDRFAVITSVPGEEVLEGICARLREVVSEVPVPRRASQIRPRIRSALGVAAMAHPDFAAVVARVEPSDDERAAS
jgi:diguanylate cyclase (GGDEF)-like protein